MTGSRNSGPAQGGARSLANAMISDAAELSACNGKVMTMTDIESANFTVRLRFLRTPEAAIYLGLSARTLEKHRCYGTGPVYHKLGGRVVYAIDDLERWSTPGARRSTSDPGQGIVHPAKRMASM